MLRISQEPGTGRKVVLKLEGRVVGPWVEELTRICEPVIDRGGVLSLDLAEVSYVDGGGVAALRALQVRGVTLERSSPFVEQQIRGCAGSSPGASAGAGC